MEESVFDPNEQNTHLESRIVAALERLSEAFRVLLWQEGKESGLSPIQIQLLIFVALHPPACCSVSYLAREFNLTKPTVSDAVKSLFQKELIEKSMSASDTRSYHVQLTDKGREMAGKLARFANAIKAPVSRMSGPQKISLWENLTTIIAALQQAGIISLQRMCFTCANYQRQGDTHFCALLRMPLYAETLRLDCPEHQAANS
jgi:DNA-binding MarR family transcriptional regulator